MYEVDFTNIPKPSPLKCPICGSNVLIMHDNLHGEYDMGWSVGCGRYKANDGIHDRKMSLFGLHSHNHALRSWMRLVGDALGEKQKE